MKWSFLYNFFCGVLGSLCSWIKTFHNDISSCIINNGHYSDYFKLGRGVRQGVPLSPYLFILVLELLAAALKNDKDITGVQIENSEFLLSQYVDDSSLILDDNPQSLENSLHVLSLFSQCSGLKVKIDKTEAIWIGSKHGSGRNISSKII